ncbi:MAG: hypothetical protein WKF97_18060 [Chitinophagaceae bacterium]
MPLAIPDTWLWFCIAFGVTLFTTLIMSLQSRFFYTVDVVVRRFTIMDLEFAANEKELENILVGINKLVAFKAGIVTVDKEKVSRALKGQIIVDFLLFMPAAYGGIFLLCMKVASQMGQFGQLTFSMLAWAQILAFLLDAVENVYLLHAIGNAKKKEQQPGLQTSALFAYPTFRLIEALKWGIALTGAVSGLSVIFHSWVSGHYSSRTYPYIWIFAGEFLLFVGISWILSKRRKNARDDE